MKIAILSDIQGNAVALEAIFSNIHQHEPNIIVCLGDVASGPEPTIVIDILRTNRCLTIKGNMDDVILNAVPYEGPDAAARMYNEIDLWAREQLSRSYLSYMRAFKDFVTLEYERVRFLGCHGSPQFYEDVIDSETPDDVLDTMLAEYTGLDLIAVGHLHRPMLRTYKTLKIVNPGSVGLPDAGQDNLMPCVAHYAIATCKDGQVTIDFHAVSYNPTLFKRRIISSGMPHADWYLSQWDVDVKV